MKVGEPRRMVRAGSGRSCARSLFVGHYRGAAIGRGWDLGEISQQALVVAVKPIGPHGTDRTGHFTLHGGHMQRDQGRRVVKLPGVALERGRHWVRSGSGMSYPPCMRENLSSPDTHVKYTCSSALETASLKLAKNRNSSKSVETIRGYTNTLTTHEPMFQMCCLLIHNTMPNS
jgi:hypothetical protein